MLKFNSYHWALLIFCLLFSQAGNTALKQLYLENLSGPGAAFLTRAQPVANSFTNLTAGSSITLDQDVAFQAPFTISATDINVTLVLQRTGGGSRTVQVEVFINGSTGTSLGTDQFTFSGGGQQTRLFTITNTALQNLTVNDYLTVVVRNIASGTVRVRQATGGTSFLEVTTDSVISIDSVGIFSNPYPDPEEFLSYTASSTVYLRATVSDPFGFADISSVDFTVNDPNSPPSVFTANIIVPEVGSTVGATAVFETPYTLPPVPAPDGVWSVDFVANEGAEGTVTDSTSKSFSVGSPALNVRKASSTVYDPVNFTSSAKSIPNSRVEYTVEITNSGFGFVDENTILITDILPSTQSTFYFGAPPDPVRFNDGAVASGLSFTFTDITDPNDDVQFSNDGCATFLLPPTVPTADPVTGYDTTVPKIDCIAINPKGSFNGSDGVNDPSFSVSFTIRVD
ncbi:MAG: hypothetical protein KJN89_05170 [Gammaproteobacteria bacterium]|nr:hypothetical protein [Gammaproteobacteria bacterium]NNJ49743.1 hypothetical protein [Gammaproteobacteria bacterium]